jgi:hypothetical protein
MTEERASSPAGGQRPQKSLAQGLPAAVTYIHLGQMWGLLEAWLGQVDYPLADIVRDWDWLSPSQRARLLQIFHALPTDFVEHIIRYGMDQAEAAGQEFGEGSESLVDWPWFFYSLLLLDISGTHAQILLPKFLSGPEPPRLKSGS